MNTAIERLTKILNLEIEQGYRDRAVIGGLDRLADHWQSQMQSSGGKELA